MPSAPRPARYAVHPPRQRAASHPAATHGIPVSGRTGADKGAGGALRPPPHARAESAPAAGQRPGSLEARDRDLALAHSRGDAAQPHWRHAEVASNVLLWHDPDEVVVVLEELPVALVGSAGQQLPFPLFLGQGVQDHGVEDRHGPCRVPGHEAFDDPEVQPLQFGHFQSSGASTGGPEVGGAAQFGDAVRQCGQPSHARRGDGGDARHHVERAAEGQQALATLVVGEADSHRTSAYDIDERVFLTRLEEHITRPDSHHPDGPAERIPIRQRPTGEHLQEAPGDARVPGGHPCCDRRRQFRPCA